MIDSHTHLIWESFAHDMSDVMNRAMAQDISHMIHPCVELKDMKDMLALQKIYNNVLICAGVHPCHADSWDDQSVNTICEHSKHIIAIGETGIDMGYTDKVNLDLQIEVFHQQAKIAEQFALPLIVHCRDAFDQIYNVLRNYKLTGVIHCYTGDAYYADMFWELGFYVSFSGCLTFKNAGKLREEAKKISLDRILIETDAPFLAPQSHRGQRNEPSYIIETCNSLAYIHQQNIEHVSRITAHNTKKLFNII